METDEVCPKKTGAFDRTVHDPKKTKAAGEKNAPNHSELSADSSEIFGTLVKHVDVESGFGK